MTPGEQRVQINFNPTGNPVVSEFKKKTAEIIDLAEKYRTGPVSTETARLWAFAQTRYEEAELWANKAATAVE